MEGILVLTKDDSFTEALAWMDIDSESMLYGLDHVRKVCDEIDSLML